MKFQFDGNQAHQMPAIASVADLLQGQSLIGIDYDRFELGQVYGPVSNRLDLDDERLLANLHSVQSQNGLPNDDQLELIEETIRTPRGDETVRFPNFSIEMETGTGKTYVYLRTALELHRRYGLRKFIIVVPSVAIREGVLKTLKVTQDHLKALYDNVPYRHTVYDPKSIARVRQFALSDCVEILVMTIDSFNKDDNVIRRNTDKLQGATPLYLIQSARPILILDEPQNMESEGRIRALASLNPLFALRYSATHRNPYNLVYRLTPFQAYRHNLVKHIEVASVVKEDDFNQVYLRLDEIRADKNTIQAKIAFQQRMAKGNIAEKSQLFKCGASLESKANRPEYATFVIDEIDKGEGFVRFRNGVSIRLGQTQGADQAALFREQIRFTVKEHMHKQAKLREAGVKVLSLFFIDKVENYVGTPPATKQTDAIDNLYPGIIRVLFDEAFDEFKKDYPDFAERSAGEVRAAYFAQKPRKGGTTDWLDSKSGTSETDRAAYNLIMRDKEQLLSFKEPVAFLFSHSALREGWDNPNVCQICTLNQTASEVKKRQEVGRGMRLVVNQQGIRQLEPPRNKLTVIANESYEQFVTTLQKEMEEAFGKEGAAPRPVNARQRTQAKRKPLEELPAEFHELWNRIRPKTRYHVTIDTPKLIGDVLKELDGLTMTAPKIMGNRASIEASADKDKFNPQLIGSGTLSTLSVRGDRPNVVAMIENLLGHVNPPIKLSRRTLINIVQQTQNQDAAIDNPHEFAAQTARLLRVHATQQLVDGIQYEQNNDFYDMSQWVEEEERPEERLVEVANSIYDKIAVDSETERTFAESASRRDDVRLIVKLPAWFKVSTPIGNYNPDWALVMQQKDMFDSEGPILYLVRETKSTTAKDELRGSENQKIQCGERHFKNALNVDYRVVTNASQLP